MHASHPALLLAGLGASLWVAASAAFVVWIADASRPRKPAPVRLRARRHF